MDQDTSYLDVPLDTRRYDIHIVPSDAQAHDERTRQCWCRPRIEKIGRRAMVIHNATHLQPYRVISMRCSVGGTDHIVNMSNGRAHGVN
jgi:hypothetical protein